MKKKYFSIVFLVLILLAVVFTSNQSIKVMKRIFATNDSEKDKDKIVIVIDPGHPDTCMG